MRKLVDFIINNIHWALFLVLELICVILIYNNSTYQGSVILSSANALVGKTNEISTSVLSFFDLKRQNILLAESNMKLKERVITLEEEQRYMLELAEKPTNILRDSSGSSSYHFIGASVVSNSVAKQNNYITINKGSIHGLKPDMGVICSDGVVGIVDKVSSGFSVVIPIINPKLRISCKLQSSEFFGVLNWEGGSIYHASITELPRHSAFDNGSAIVTSGYSAIFPEGLLIGTIDSFEEQQLQSNFYKLRIKLATSFETLQHVFVISNTEQQERLLLEKEVDDDN